MLAAFPATEPTGVRRTLTLRPTSRGKIIGDDAAIRGVLATIDRVATSPATVLVTGESGTGKELVVAALHDASDRRAAMLVTINCGAIPAELVESELFGHAKGAFTGAQVAKKGFVAAAEGGTLFLDEVGELPPAAQVKLLRLLQQREYTPVGDTRAIKCDVRIVAATNRDLAVEVAAGRFREDLYYRLDVIHLHLPALRDRGSDLRLLATHFFRAFAAASGRSELEGISEQALDAVAAHPWPGNVRALENAIERGVLLATGRFVEAEDILGREAPSPPRATASPALVAALPDEGLDLFAVGRAWENDMIRQALERTGGNRNRAAQLLGLNRTTLVEIIRRRGLAAAR